MDWAVRIGTLPFEGTWAIYSHVELVSPWGYWYSASKRDGGVRRKATTPKHGHWDYVRLPDDIGRAAVEYIQPRIGLPYDLTGAVCGPVFGVQHDAPGPFCTELLCPALGWPDAWTMSPGAMMRRAARLWGIQYNTTAPYAGCEPTHQPSLGGAAY